MLAAARRGEPAGAASREPRQAQSQPGPGLRHAALHVSSADSATSWLLSALNKPADDAVWGLAALEVSKAASLDQAQQVAKARAAIADHLARPRATSHC